MKAITPPKNKKERETESYSRRKTEKDTAVDQSENDNTPNSPGKVLGGDQVDQSDLPERNEDQDVTGSDIDTNTQIEIEK